MHEGGGGSRRAVVANLGRTSKLARRRFRQPIAVRRMKTAFGKFFLPADDDFLCIRFNAHYEVRLTHCYSEPLALADREAFDSGMCADNTTSGRDNLSGHI